MIYIVNINDKVYEVEVERGKANIVKTTQAILPAPVAEAVRVENNNTISQTSITSDNVKGEAVKSPLPGTVLDIKVNVGAKVKKGQVLMILEAMKMESEVFAPIDGVVSQIYVSKGSITSTNEIMMVIQ